MGDAVFGPVLVLGGGGAAVLGAEPDVPALLRHLALHPSTDLDGTQFYDASYRRLVPVRDAAGTVVALQPVDNTEEPADETARRERVRAQLTRALALLRRALAAQTLYQQATTALATATAVGGGVKDPLVRAAMTAAEELVDAARALLTAAGMQPVPPATVADLSALLIDVSAPDLHAGLDRAAAMLAHSFGSVVPNGDPAGPPVDPNTGSPGHNMLHSLFGDFHREQPR